MSEHTKGPWVYEKGTKTIRSVPENYWLATMDSWDGAVNHEANARLIAAAPDMKAELLEVHNDLQTLLDYLNDCVDGPLGTMANIIEERLEKGREILKKIEGA